MDEDEMRDFLLSLASFVENLHNALERKDGNLVEYLTRKIRESIDVLGLICLRLDTDHNFERTYNHFENLMDSLEYDLELAQLRLEEIRCENENQLRSRRVNLISQETGGRPWGS